MNRRKIHYCWFGKGKLPDLALKCIASWRKYCPDYEIIEWNEENFNINSNEYVKEAYENKKYAFVSDYVRLYALYKYGGIYMDTDVELLKELDSYLKEEAFSGFERIDAIPTGIMGCKQGNKIFKEFLAYYDNKKFVKEDGSLDITTNVEIITNICLDKGLILNNEEQNIEGFKLYKKEIFCPKNPETGKIELTNETVAIHHFSGSWIPKHKKLKKKFINFIGKEKTQILVKYKSKFRKLVGRG
ncbi:MAG: glycosyltransferase family 32 protein [Clostridium sp.]|uniref:glycosyltransferase family 32 protein n=1 Tax=Clostridium sp. TaxID=1506 RepID=UPI003F3B541B